MWIRITTHVKDNPDMASEFHRLYVASYADNTPGAGLTILRNNIYRYEITGLSPELALTLNVKPWDTEEPTEWSYEDNPALTDDGYLEWEGTPEINKTTASVLYQGTPLVGTFAFDQPRGDSWWYANLIPANEDTPNDAFYFVDENGDRLAVSPSGKIDGEPATIRIAATDNTTDKQRAARLVFTVHTFDGRTLTANVLNPGDYPDYQQIKYFTITQNEQ